MARRTFRRERTGLVPAIPHSTVELNTVRCDGTVTDHTVYQRAVLEGGILDVAMREGAVEKVAVVSFPVGRVVHDTIFDHAAYM